jgi:hypothetical protein
MAAIFLSYAREDEPRARTLATALESRGWSVFWDRRIPHGKDFNAHIQQQLDDARCIVVLWSKASLASHFVRDEATEGLNGRLVPALIEAVRQPLGFRQLQAADLSDWHGVLPHDEFDRFVDSIASVVPPSSDGSESATRASEAHEEQVLVEPDVNPPFMPSVSFVGGDFNIDVYISFAALDNTELVEGHSGWITNFHRALQIRLGQLIGAEPVISRDPKRRGTDSSAGKLIDQMQRVAVFVSVVSPRYVKSEAARKEWVEFRKAVEQQSGDHRSDNARVFKILKKPVPLEKQPRELQGLLGYEFFKIDPDNGKVREFDRVFGPEAERDFWMRLDDLVHDIARVLGDLRKDPSGNSNTK